MSTTYKPAPSGPPHVPPHVPPPLAEDAAIAERPAGNCSICQRPIAIYDRYASLVPTGLLAHVRCIAAAAAAPRTRVPAIW